MGKADIAAAHTCILRISACELAPARAFGSHKTPNDASNARYRKKVFLTAGNNLRRATVVNMAA
jgi:hypothetical protein